jgi:hypothetical protein
VSLISIYCIFCSSLDSLNSLFSDCKEFLYHEINISYYDSLPAETIRREITD